MTNLANLTTEGRNPASESIDRLSALEIVCLMNAEDAGVAEAVGREAESIARAIEAIAARLGVGGRLVYLGAGTSGRLGVLDAAECPPTFNSPPGQVVGLIAGGHGALIRAVEGAEDRPETAVEDLKSVSLSAGDVVVGIATSGRTPYVLAGLRYARELGAYAIGLSCNRDAELVSCVDLAIIPVVGPEVISGSTRLKAGTATKMVLNLLTTGAMVLLGKTYGNLMVDLRATNTKLRQRSVRIVAALAGIPEPEAEQVLARCDGEVKTAILAHRCRLSPEEARRRLQRSGGHLRRAIEEEQIVPPAGAGGPRSEELVLGIDGGGSKTIARLAQRGPDGEPVVIGRGAAGASNLQTVGQSRALENLDRAIAAAFAEAGVQRGTLDAAVLALAGSDREESRRVFLRWADHRRLARSVQLVHDAAPVLSAGTPEGWGVALIAGTGSFAFGQTRDGRFVRAGGWGYLLGDEGGGYAIALAGLRAAAKAADGRGMPTALVAALLDRLGLATPLELVAAVHRLADDRAAIAELAQVVVALAGQGDRVAQAIVDRSAGELAGMVQAVVVRLDLAGAPFPLALAGGMLLGCEPLRRDLLDQLISAGLAPDPITLVPDPVAGAVKMAITACRSAPL